MGNFLSNVSNLFARPFGLQAKRDVHEAATSTTATTSNTKKLLEDEWRCIGKVTDLTEKRCRRVHAESGKEDDLVLIAWKGTFSAMSTWCRHMRGPLYNGAIIEYNNKSCIQCPWHGYIFDIEDGVNVCPDPTLRQETFATKELDGNVYIFYPKSQLSLEPFNEDAQ